MKIIKNISNEVYNHNKFFGLFPGDSVAVEDEVAAQILADFPDRFKDMGSSKSDVVLYDVMQETKANNARGAPEPAPAPAPAPAPEAEPDVVKEDNMKKRLTGLRKEKTE